MKQLIKERGYESLKDLIKALGSDIDANDNKVITKIHMAYTIWITDIKLNQNIS